jgi:hypothetical protein
MMLFHPFHHCIMKNHANHLEKSQKRHTAMHVEKQSLHGYRRSRRRRDGEIDLVDLLNRWAVVATGGTWATSAWKASWATAGHATHTSRHAALSSSAIEFHHNLLKVVSIIHLINFLHGWTIIWG